MFTTDNARKPPKIIFEQHVYSRYNPILRHNFGIDAFIAEYHKLALNIIYKQLRF